MINSKKTIEEEAFSFKKWLLLFGLFWLLNLGFIFAGFKIFETQSVAMIGLVFVLVLAWNCGRWGGLVGGFLLPLLSVPIGFKLAGHSQHQTGIPFEGFAGVTAHCIIGFFFGFLSDSLKQSKREIARRIKLEAELKNYQDNLEKLVSQRTEELSNANEHLRQSEKLEALGQLTGGIAHDFNNMLAGIVGNTELIRVNNDNKDAELTELSNEVIQISMQAAGLVRKLLSFSRKVPSEIKELDIHQVINNVLKILSHSVDKRIQISKYLNAAQSMVLGDEARLQNVLLNMGINARDAMTDGGNLSFETETVTIDDRYLNTHGETLVAGTYLAISVSDTGVGMDAETKRKVFDPFFTTKKPGKGTGMGLASAYGTIMDHKGSIEVYTEENNGTVFRIYLPIKSMQQVKVEPQAETPIRGTGHIFLIEDSESVRLATTKMLVQLGYTVSAFQDGVSALSAYSEKKETVRMVITDLMLPKITGSEIIKELEIVNPQVKILVISGYSTLSMPTLQFSTKTRGFLQKPFDLLQLSTKVNKILTAD